MIVDSHNLEFLIDFLNIAFLNRYRNKARLVIFNLVKKKIRDLYPFSKILGVADPSTPYKIDNRYKYEKLKQNQIISQVGPGEKADYYLLEYAKNHPNCFIISNDAFKEYDIKEQLRKRIIPVGIINNEVIFSQKLYAYLQDEEKIIAKT